MQKTQSKRKSTVSLIDDLFRVAATLNLLFFILQKIQKMIVKKATFSKAYSMSKIFEMPGEACSKSVKVIKDFSSFFSSWPLNWKSF